MQKQTDQELLEDYFQSRSEAAFGELARRHVDLVYSAAWRMVRNAHLAEDVTQGVFIALAQNAGKLADRPVLAGWLHRTAQNLASNAIRSDARRRVREQEAAAMNELMSPAPDVEWEKISPQLDAALGELSEADRDALLLRYFERKSAQEIAQILGVSSEAAQKRVNRAVERLRNYFSKRKVIAGASGLTAVITANAVQAAPAGLAAAVSAASILAGSVAGTSPIIATAKIIVMTILQKTFVAAVVAVIAGAGIYEMHQASRLRSEIQMLRQEQAPLAGQLEQLLRENEDSTNRLAVLRDELAKAKSDRLELLKLRNEISALKRVEATGGMKANSGVLANDTATNGAGEELGQAIVRGEAGAFEKLLAETRAEHQSFRDKNTGLNDQERGEVSRQIFAPINGAFKVIGDAAAQGSRQALDALTRALEIPDLNGLAVSSLGSLAGNGDAAALEVLVHPEKYGAQLSDTISALQPAADNGNQTAIDALAAVAKNQDDQPLWNMTARSLTQAAAAGNQAAVDALISMSSTTNQNIQSAVVEGLKSAAAIHNAKAAEALRAMAGR